MLKLTSQIVAHTQLAPDIWLMALKCPEPFLFHPGQYVLVHIDHHDPNTKAPYPRAYSIAGYVGTVAEDGRVHASEISLIYKRYSGGVATTCLESKNAGDSLTIQGPAGHYTLARHLSNEARALNFVMTGTGIAPVICMLQSLLVNNYQLLIVNLYWGLPTRHDVYLQKELVDLKREFARRSIDLSLTLCLSREKTGVLPDIDQFEVFGSRLQPVLDGKIEKPQPLDRLETGSHHPEQAGNGIGLMHGSRNEPQSGPFGVREISQPNLTSRTNKVRSGIHARSLLSDSGGSQLAARGFPGSSSDLFSLCGSGAFVQDMRAHLISRGIAPKYIVFERFS